MDWSSLPSPACFIVCFVVLTFYDDDLIMVINRIAFHIQLPGPMLIFNITTVPTECWMKNIPSEFRKASQNQQNDHYKPGSSLWRAKVCLQVCGNLFVGAISHTHALMMQTKGLSHQDNVEICIRGIVYISTICTEFCMINDYKMVKCIFKLTYAVIKAIYHVCP